MPNGIILLGHGENRDILRIIPKEEFEAFWSAAFSCRDEASQSWTNVARLGDPSTLALTPPVGESKCHIWENGKETEEEFSLIQVTHRYI